MKKSKLKKNQCYCTYCGQPRPYPTEPGIWEFTESPLNKNAVWERVRVKYSNWMVNPENDKPYLELETMDGIPVHWPAPAVWRQVKTKKKKTIKKIFV